MLDNTELILLEDFFSLINFIIFAVLKKSKEVISVTINDLKVFWKIIINLRNKYGLIIVQYKSCFILNIVSNFFKIYLTIL